MFDLSVADLAQYELAQRRESGYDLADIGVADGETFAGWDEAKLADLLGRLSHATRRNDWAYDEPEDWAAIEAALPRSTAGAYDPGTASLGDRVLGGWLGRCIGCTLGKPVEQGEEWTYQRIRRYLELAGAYPLRGYLPEPQDSPDLPALRPSWQVATAGRIHGCPRDDDIDYTILGLHVLETHGLGFATEDVGAAWLARLPFAQTYTAERAAYRNLVNGLTPPATAEHENPYREWIGAQIRADVFGYVSPGAPRRAAELAYRDARLSHVGNGIYAAMWAASLIAAAFVVPTAGAALAESLRHVPESSRLAEALRFTCSLHDSGSTWEAARERIEQRYGSYGWVHAVNNAALVAAGLLWGDGDFATTVGLTVQGGWDTDSNGATAGSVAGVLAGAARLPEALVAPLQDRVQSAIFGFDGAGITDLARRTTALAGG